MTFERRYKLLSWLPRASGSLATFCSLLIIVDVLLHRKKKERTKQNLLVGMSVADVMASMFMALSTWPVPEGEDVFGAIGNTATCNAQGFFIQMGVATPLYNALLAVYYLLVIRYGWSERDFHRLEVVGHISIWSLALSTSVAGLLLEQYNNAFLWCWIAPPSPTTILLEDCVMEEDLSPTAAADFVNENEGSLSSSTFLCDGAYRENHARIFRLAFYFVWLWLAALIVTVATAGVVHTVFVRVREGERFTPRGSTNSSRKHMHAVTIQAILYVGAFYLTTIFPTLGRTLRPQWGDCDSTCEALGPPIAFFFPLQGFWNAMTYFRPRIVRATLSWVSYTSRFFGFASAAAKQSSSTKHPSSGVTSTRNQESVFSTKFDPPPLFVLGDDDGETPAAAEANHHFQEEDRTDDLWSEEDCVVESTPGVVERTVDSSLTIDVWNKEKDATAFNDQTTRSTDRKRTHIPYQHHRTLDFGSTVHTVNIDLVHRLPRRSLPPTKHQSV